MDIYWNNVFLLCSVNESYYTEFWMINQPCNPEWNQNWTYILSFPYITACFCKYYLLKVSFMFLSSIGQYFSFLFSFCFKTKLLCFCKLKWWIILHFPFLERFLLGGFVLAKGFTRLYHYLLSNTGLPLFVSFSFLFFWRIQFPW